MIISIKIVGRDKLVMEIGDRSDGLTEISVKLEIRGREWIIGMEDANASRWIVI